MTNKSVIIIGAGIAGLSAGCYLQMNGYRTQIFELHDKPGGLCASWNRLGYTIDGCVHWLLGARPGIDFYQFWEELGAVQGRTMVELEEYMRIEGKDGQAFILYTDEQRLEQHMKELAPEDADTIDELIKGAKIAGSLDVSFMKAPEVQNLAEKAGPMLKMLPHLPFVMKWAKFPFGDYGQRFKNPFLREAFAVLTEDVAGMPALGLFQNIAWYGKGVTGYPVGGFLAFARAIERRYPGLAGQVEMVDVATPTTFERYTGNWQGNHQGWLPTTEQFGLRMKKTLPGLENFYMAGQWVEPGGGLPLAAVSGRYVTQIVCKSDKKTVCNHSAMRLKTVGVSFCRGDIYLDLGSKWVRKLVMTLSENTVTSMWGVPIERSKPVTILTIRAMNKDEFDRD